MHPKTCQRFLSFGDKDPRGCMQGQKCDNFHPRMCQYSLQKQICHDMNCPVLHRKGTMRTPFSQNLHQFDTNNPNYDWMTTRPNFVEPYQECNMQFNSFSGYNNYNKKRNIKNKGYYPSANQRYGYNYGQTQYQPGHFLEKGLIQNLQQQIRENSFQMKNILERIEAMQSHYQMARIPHLIPSQLQNQTQMGQFQNPMAMQTQQMNPATQQIPGSG